MNMAKFQTGENVEFIYNSKKYVGKVIEVYPDTDELLIASDLHRIAYLFKCNCVAKVRKHDNVKLPKFVSEWIATANKCDFTLFELINYDNGEEYRLPPKVSHWILEDINNEEILADAWCISGGEL
ncbi:hypothetical protein LP114_068 [Listeria phage LP-114]|uniref:DUF1642 domain-containing protein n=1 Tax=Listeria phage LP-114 TaxID=1458857 RepID=A0A059T7M0_9CAUD|nr:hypothetical protein LP114_068 [Listeria phage LP-114]AHL18656.1 hypothetical protein LP114_068 [Listeria phage LP-114]